MSKNNSFCGIERIKNIIKTPGVKLHFTGVGGVGMYSLFLLSSMRGISVSGSDKRSSPLFSDLVSRGFDVSLGAYLSSVASADGLVYTLAVSEDDEEIKLAESRGIPIISRAEYMSALTDDYGFKIGVSGTHGKSTVTAMLAEIFKCAEKIPTVISGAALNSEKTPLLVGSSDYLIYESCEYKDSFLKFSPDVSVFTNLEYDHVDYFENIDMLKSSFLRAASLAEIAVLNIDDENLASVGKSLKKDYITYSIGGDADVVGILLSEKRGKYSFTVSSRFSESFRINLNIPGKFNVYNALAAVSASLKCGIDKEYIIKALESFSGIERRLQQIDVYKGASVFFDYAHHPTEIKAGIETLKSIGFRSVTVIFRPHTYTRTAALWSDFVSALSLADRVILLDIDPIREKTIENVNSDLLAKCIGNTAVYCNAESVAEYLKDSDYGAIIVMGAADMTRVLEILKKDKE